jgi:putative (di)nucleoside polyphosphate hydrolase
MTPDEIARLPYRPCVGVALTDGRGRLFAGERRDAPGAWQMPQGGIDAGETPIAAALRELAEETGIAPDRVEIVAETPEWIAYDLPPELVGRVWGGRWRGQRQKWVLLRFLGRDGEIDIATPHPEFSAWRWLTPEEMLAAIVPFKRAVYAEVLGRFAPLLGGGEPRPG